MSTVPLIIPRDSPTGTPVESTSMSTRSSSPTTKITSAKQWRFSWICYFSTPSGIYWNANAELTWCVNHLDVVCCHCARLWTAVACGRDLKFALFYDIVPFERNRGSVVLKKDLFYVSLCIQQDWFYWFVEVDFGVEYYVWATTVSTFQEHTTLLPATRLCMRWSHWCFNLFEKLSPCKSMTIKRYRLVLAGCIILNLAVHRWFSKRYHQTRSNRVLLWSP